MHRVKTKKLWSTSDFELVIEDNQSCLLWNSENGILWVRWRGIVDAKTASSILASALNSVEQGHASKVLLDRSAIEEFTTGARLWIKEDFLKKRAQPLSHLIEKIGSVKPDKSMARIYSHLVSSIIRVVFPSFSIVEFNSSIEAIDWLMDEN